MRGLAIHGLALVMAAAAAGCEEAPPVPVPAGPLADAGSEFDPATAGAIRGRVTWEGDLPEVPPFHAPVSPLSEQAGGKSRSWPNPNPPAVHPATRGVAGAVVFLQGVDPRRACPWNHPLLTVQQRDFQIHVLQGGSDRRTGFVRRGTAVTFTSVQPVLDSLQARGAAFFSLPFPIDAQPCTRILDRRGTVELSSGVGHFWMRAYLFVDDHPYYTHTDSSGRFALEQVPPGTYEVVCWHPDWHEAGRELDADTGLVTRLTFRPPVTSKQAITLKAGGKGAVGLRLGPGLFGR
jgi:hypothetical protein